MTKSAQIAEVMACSTDDMERHEHQLSVAKEIKSFRDFNYSDSKKGGKMNKSREELVSAILEVIKDFEITWSDMYLAERIADRVIEEMREEKSCVNCLHSEVATFEMPCKECNHQNRKGSGFDYWHKVARQEKKWGRIEKLMPFPSDEKARLKINEVIDRVNEIAKEVSK